MSLPFGITPGSIIAGKYRVVGPLGSGGMGVVIEAMHVRLDQRVAIKLLSPDLTKSKEHVVRFEREARAAGKLTSPHAVRIIDVDTMELDGSAAAAGGNGAAIPYMVMELLEGNDMATESERAVIPLARLVDWIVQVCSALSEAHEAGIVHRDLKPSNIFLCGNDENKFAKVLDFGISKTTSQTEDITTLTTDKVLGTPRFMSPEQMRGSKDIDARSDIWSMGVILYRVLARRYPFEGEHHAALALAVVATDPVHLREHRPDLPAGFADLVMRMLEKRPVDRFANVDALTAAIRSFGTGATPLPRASGSSLTPRRAANPISVDSTELAKAAELSTESMVVSSPTTVVESVAVSTSPKKRPKNLLLIAVVLAVAVAIPFALKFGRSENQTNKPNTGAATEIAAPTTQPIESATSITSAAQSSTRDPPTPPLVSAKPTTRPQIHLPAASRSATPAPSPSDTPLHL